MPTLLKIDVSPRGGESVSRALTAAFAEEWQSAHPGAPVITRDLAANEIPFVDLPWIAGVYAPPEQHTPEMQQALSVSSGFIEEFLSATDIILGTPLYNFNLPARLKAWIDHIVFRGRTFSAGPEGYKGLAGGRKVTVALASAGVYTPGSPAAPYDFATPYLKGIFGFLGIPDVNILYAGDSRALAMGEISKDAYFPPLLEQARTAARA